MATSITSFALANETGGTNTTGYNLVQTWNVYFAGGYSVFGIYNVAHTAGLPIFNDSDSTTFCYAADIKIELDSNDGGVSTGKAIYTVTFAQKTLTYDPNPLSRPADIQWGGSDQTEVPTKDTTGAALVNSAGELYDGLPERPLRGCATCTITRNESANPATVVTTYSNTTNDTAWNGVGIGNALLGKITGVKQHEIVNGSDVVYWRVTYPIDFNNNGWLLKPIDNGWLIAVDTDGDSVDDDTRDYTDDTGSKPTKQILLDGSGHKLAMGGTPVVFPTAGYKVLDESTFATLSLPNPFA